MKQFFAPILLLILLLPSSSLAKSENVSVQLQCDGLVTIYNDDRLKVSKPLEIPNTGISIEIREKTVLVAGSLGWDGKFEITRKDAASIFSRLCKTENILVLSIDTLAIFN